jgi:hypothetical protein
VGAEFAWPDGTNSLDQVTITVEYSMDGGNSWTQAATTTRAGIGSRVESVGGAITPVVSKWLQIRVTVSGIVDWSPVLLGLWAEAVIFG